MRLGLQLWQKAMQLCMFMFRGEGVRFCLPKILDSSPFPNRFVTDGSTDAHKKKSVSADATFIFFYHSVLPKKWEVIINTFSTTMRMVFMVPNIKLWKITDLFQPMGRVLCKLCGRLNFPKRENCNWQD